MAIHKTAIVDRKAELGEVEIGPYAVVGPGVQLHDGVVVDAHAVIHGPCVVGERTRIHSFACIGGDPQDRSYAGEKTGLTIGTDNVFRECVTISRGTAPGKGKTVIGDHNLFMAYVHVGHDGLVGSHCVLANSVALAGHVEVEDHAVLGGLSGVHQNGRIGRNAMLGGGAMATQDVPPFTIAQGDRARLFGLNIIGMRRSGIPDASITALREAYREIFDKGSPLRIAMDRVRAKEETCAEVDQLLQFIAGSRRGICRASGREQGAD
jgi:UDP-N-acetylglucosamine acyltransferase